MTGAELDSLLLNALLVVCGSWLVYFVGRACFALWDWWQRRKG